MSRYAASDAMDDPTLYWFCADCDRAFLKSERGIYCSDGVQVETCGYRDCDGTAEAFLEWANLHQWSKNRYPRVPLYGAYYPLNDSEPGKWIKTRRFRQTCNGDRCQNQVGQQTAWMYRCKDGQQFCIACAQGRKGSYNGCPYVIGFPPFE